MKRANRQWILAITSAAFLGGAALGAEPAKDRALGAQDFKTLEELHHGNLMEESMGAMASTQAKDKRVKDFGERMMKDHNKLDKDLMEFANKNAIQNLDAKPALPAAEKSKQHASMEKLKTLTGEAFDKAYMQMMREDHDKDVKKVSEALTKTTNKDLKDLLEHTLSVMKDHQKDANDWIQHPRT